MVRHIVILGALATCGSVASAAEYIVIAGHALENTYADVEECCPEGFICMHSWHRYRIRVKDVIRGEKLSGTITAVKMQHISRVIDRREVALFVLTRIEDLTERTRLGAQFILHEFSRPTPMFCFRAPPQKYGIANRVYDDTYKDEDEFRFEKAAL